MNWNRFSDSEPPQRPTEQSQLEKADMQLDLAKEPRVITDPPTVVDLKLEYRELDERHEVVKRWPDSIARDSELERVCKRKAEIAMEIARL